ncbi:MAG: 3-deoxy-8-phosphooctulonate synthase [Candidatus Omnitrophica bacterium]|nr:3-deoxy-8-phosphooctulonate synthase [Candidatus Omnitrophota bacterium]
MKKIIKLGNIKFGGGNPFVLIAGPCVIEDKKTVMTIASQLKDITSRLKVPFIFKASYDKANRTSISSFRGPGLKEGLAILKEVKDRFDVPVTSDVHEIDEVKTAAKVLDILQIPAFLCRQTDLLIAVAQTKKIVNIKKGQFLAPWDMKAAVEKVRQSGNENVLLTERGSTFGYNNLVTDFRSLAIMGQLGCPVIMDVSHSVQQPGGLGNATGGKSEFIPLLARCGVAAGCDGIFMEVHTDPSKALSDGPNMLRLDQLEDLLVDLIAIDKVIKNKKD